MTIKENFRMRIFDPVLAEERYCKQLMSAQVPETLLNETRPLRVAIYIRTVITCDREVPSRELMIETFKKQIEGHPNWTYVGIYHDECFGMEDYLDRKAMREMIKECRAGKIDLIITSSAACIAGNITDFISVVKILKRLEPPVGIWCETDNIYTLDLDTDLALKVLSEFAQEECRQKAQHGGGHRW